MAQPSVAAYFNTRKRNAVEDNKINLVRKVLLIDGGTEGTREADLKSCNNDFTNKQSPVFIHHKQENVLAANKINAVSNKSSGQSNRIKVRGIKKCFTKNDKNQRSLQQFVKNMSKMDSDLEQTKTADGLVSGMSSPINTNELVTPPSSPRKISNAMDKPNVSKLDHNLKDIKLKLSRSSRLAELKASMSAFNDLSKQLKETEKKTSNISKPLQLKSFKSFEMEINLSPQKVQSPEKLYLSPKKDTTVRKNLLNLLSPTKNAVALPESPSSKILDLTSKPALTLPFKYRYLAEIFRAIDTVCQILYNRHETITFNKLKPAVEEMLKRNVNERCLSQIKEIYPDAFTFNQEKLRLYGTGKREEKWELIITPVVKDSDHMTSDFLLTRRRNLYNILLDKVKQYHHEFLLSLDPPMHIQKDKITRWHPEFDIERVPDLELSVLPQPPFEQKLTTGKEVLDKAREIFNCNTRMEKALQRLKDAQDKGPIEAPTVEEPKLTSVLKGIPKALLEKVRQRQAAKALVSMTRSADKEKELQMYSRLPELARIMRNLFVAERKSVLTLDNVAEKLGNCYRVTLSKIEMENHIKLLCAEVKDWIVLHEIRNTVFVKLKKNADISVVINKLEQLTKEKSEL